MTPRAWSFLRRSSGPGTKSLEDRERLDLCRLIGPMQIFKDHDCRHGILLELDQKLGGDRQPVRPGLNSLQQLRWKLKGNIEDGPRDAG